MAMARWSTSNNFKGGLLKAMNCNNQAALSGILAPIYPRATLWQKQKMLPFNISPQSLHGISRPAKEVKLFRGEFLRATHNVPNRNFHSLFLNFNSCNTEVLVLHLEPSDCCHHSGPCKRVVGFEVLLDHNYRWCWCLLCEQYECTLQVCATCLTWTAVVSWFSP